MKKALLIVLVFALFSCKSNNKEFTITGLTSNLLDSTKIFLTNSTSSKTLDSTIILGHKFKFKGFVDSIESFTIHTKNFKDYKVLWIDNSDITLDASKSSLRKGKISGSHFQNLNSQYIELENHFRNDLDSLNSLIRHTDKQDSTKLRSLQSKKDSVDLKKQSEILKFIKNNSNFYLNPFYITFLMFTQPSQVTKSMYDAMSIKAQESRWGKAVSTYINKSIDLKIGDHAVDFSLPDIKGNLITLSSYMNKYVLLEFWASWCGPCRQENPNLLEMYRKYQNDGFDILGVSIDELKSSWESTITSDTLLWTTVCDLKGNLGEVPITYRVYGIPTNYLISPQGTIIDINLRGNALNDRLQTIFKK
jgi:peroxiredoxin